MFSQTAEYTLRVVVFLATLKGSPATTKQLAAATRVPEGYLAKIIQTLVRAGLVQSQRGLGGGSTLAKDPANITMYDVISAVTPVPRIKTCPLGLESHGSRLCPVHRRLDDAMALTEKVFRESTIAELLADRAGSIPLEDLAALSTDAKAATRAAELAFPVGQPVGVTIGGKKPAKGK